MTMDTSVVKDSTVGEIQLDELRQRLNISLSAVGSAGSWDWDIPAGLLRFDGRLSALYGLEPADGAEGLTTETFFAAIHPADSARIRIAVAGMLNGAEVFLKSYRVIDSGGLVHWVEAHGRCHYGADERPERFSGILVDVTDRRRVEERLRIAQTAGGVGTFEHVPGFGTATVSDQFCRLLGLNPAAVLPVSTINRLVSDGGAPLLQVGDSPAEELPYSEISIIRADDGQQRWIARRGEALGEGDESGVRHVGVIYDITDAKRAEGQLRELNETLESRVEQEIARRIEIEEALRQAQKMEAVGQLTGGIAHDFNNLLTVILGNLDMALRRLGSGGDERVERAISNAFKGAERAAALTQRLLAFSRRQPLDPKPIDIRRLLGGMAELLSRTIGEGIALETEAEAGLWPIEVDPNQLENAVLNLAVNARDAMAGEGCLTLSASNVERGRTLPGGAPAPRDYVVLSVADTGSGMPQETIDRAFEPFFTTKDVGKGTGLGLSMVYGFVKQSGGDIAIQSSPGTGTTICLYLPRLVGDTQAEIDLADEEAERSTLRETILVVEDDSDVRQYAVDSLCELGYVVLEASGGASALELLRAEEVNVDLILTDVIMPGMSGRQLADAAQALRSGLRVLYTSGYPRDVIVQDGRLEAGVDLLPKPFTFQALATKVRESLDKTGS